jgi:hypothetical protein
MTPWKNYVMTLQPLTVRLGMPHTANATVATHVPVLTVTMRIAGTMTDRTFTCNECHTTGSLRWMETHDCQGVQDVNQFGGHCEDYPCCGHMLGECAPQESFTKEYWQDRMNDPDYDDTYNYVDY